MKISFSASTLKVVAILTMVVDHVGLLFFPHQIIWRVFGRIAFPLFAFFIAEGHRRTSNLGRYAIRLYILAIFSQIPLELFYRAIGISSIPFNILFTLTAGLIALRVMTQLSLWFSIPLITFIIFTAELLNFEYGAYGVITILASHIILQRKLLGIFTLSILPILQSIVQAIAGIVFVQYAAVLSVPFAALYNGKRGLSFPRYLFYGFYPIHLILLWLIWLFLR
jgi:hypothetical protein